MISIEFEDLRPGDWLFVPEVSNYRIVKEIMYSGGGKIGFKNYDGVYIILTNCGGEILLHQTDKLLIKRRYAIKKIGKVAGFAAKASI